MLCGGAHMLSSEHSGVCQLIDTLASHLKGTSVREGGGRQKPMSFLVAIGQLERTVRKGGS